MAKSELTLHVSLDKVIGGAFASFARSMEKEHGVVIHSVAFDWAHHGRDVGDPRPIFELRSTSIDYKFYGE